MFLWQWSPASLMYISLLDKMEPTKHSYVPTSRRCVYVYVSPSSSHCPRHRYSRSITSVPNTLKMLPHKNTKYQLLIFEHWGLCYKADNIIRVIQTCINYIVRTKWVNSSIIYVWGIEWVTQNWPSWTGYCFTEQMLVHG